MGKDPAKLDKYRGCLIGGAAGDALGYIIEFMGEETIFAKYGPKGITEYELTGKVAQVSDDTQMTLFTAKGMLLAPASGKNDRILGEYHVYVARAYYDWLLTQTMDYPIDTSTTATYTDLIDVPELYSRRAPGFTCMTAIKSGDIGSVEEPINDSKGCGGVMRVAPIGLYFGSELVPKDQADMVGAHVAAITHGHQLGYIPGAMMAHMIRRIVHEDAEIRDAVRTGLEFVKRAFPEAYMMVYFEELIKRAVDLADAAERGQTDDLAAIHALGKGWVAEEALAIAIYCALRYGNDIDGALIAAVNHEGDSDSTGSITGNIIGAKIGYSNIPSKYTETLEMRDVILRVADEMFKYGL